jgi:hypothetical protein
MKNGNIEILPSPQHMLQAPIRREEVQRLVQEQVAQIMAERDAIAFEPFFRSRQVAYELKRLQSVPEQEKFRIAYDRYGCLDCKTQDRPHAGNGMCNKCRAKWFVRFTQIISERIEGKPAQAAAGTPMYDRLLPSERTGNVHHTWYRRSSQIDLLLYARVARRLGIDSMHVREVAFGRRHSEEVSAALKEETAALKKESERVKAVTSPGKHPHALMTLARNREKQSMARLDELGIPPEKAAVTLEACKEAILKHAPGSEEHAAVAYVIFEAAMIATRDKGYKALRELISNGLIRRIGKGSNRDPFRHFAIRDKRP